MCGLCGALSCGSLVLALQAYCIRGTIEKFLLHPPFREKGRFLWLAEMCVVIWDVWEERNDLVFRGR